MQCLRKKAAEDRPIGHKLHGGGEAFGVSMLEVKYWFEEAMYTRNVSFLYSILVSVTKSQ